MTTKKVDKVPWHITVPRWISDIVTPIFQKQGNDLSEHTARLNEKWIEAGCPKSFRIVPIPFVRFDEPNDEIEASYRPDATIKPHGVIIPERTMVDKMIADAKSGLKKKNAIRKTTGNQVV